MENAVEISATFNGRPLEVLADLVEKRAKYLKNETTRQSVIATAINIFTSLKSDANVAPRKATPDMITVRDTGFVAGWRRDPGSKRRVRCVRSSTGGTWLPHYHPVQLMGQQYKPGEYGHIYEIKMRVNKGATFEQNRHPDEKAWFVMAKSRDVAIKYGIERMTHYMKKSSGMAKYALGIAQAKVSDRKMENTAEKNTSKQRKIAFDAAKIEASGGDGTFSVVFFDELDYSVLAQKSGDSSVQTAMMKAANRTAGIINHIAGYRLDEDIPTPFPEVSEKR